MSRQRRVVRRLISSVSNLVRALAAELPGGAVRAAQDIVSCVLPVSLGADAGAAAGLPEAAAAAAADAAADAPGPAAPATAAEESAAEGQG